MTKDQGRHMKHAAAGALALILLACRAPNAFAADAGLTVRTDSDAAIISPRPDSCGPTLVEHYTRYLLHELSPFGSKKFLLVTQRFRVGTTDCLEGNDPASIDVEGHPIDVRTGAVDPRSAWSFTTTGTEGRLDPFTSGPLYRVDMRGCCAAENTAKYFSLDTGHLVASSTVPLLRIQVTDIKADRNRFIGAESNIASSPQASMKAMATLFFGDDEGVLQTVSISSQAPYGHEDWGVSELSLPGNQPVTALRSTARTNIHVVLGCRCNSAPIDLTVPVSDVGIDISAVIRVGPSVELAVRQARLPENGHSQ